LETWKNNGNSSYPEELVDDGANGISELFCAHCGDNHFGFYKKKEA